MGILTEKMKVLIVLSCLLAVSLAATGPRNELTCEICTDIITDIDNWLTSDKTEQEIIDFVSGICKTLGDLIPGFEATCNFLIQSQLPNIVDGLVHDNLDPNQVCESVLGACP